MLTNFFKIIVFIFSLSYLTYGDAQQYAVLGIGAPCMDFLMNVEEQFLLSLGKKGGSQQTEWSFVEKIIQQSKVQKSYVTAGGSCSNTIKGLSSLGHKCAFFGKLGQDEMGLKYCTSLCSYGIVPLCLSSQQSTQVCMCLISSDGDRTMRCYPGAANELTSDELTETLFQGVKLVHIEGYMLYCKDKTFVATAMKLAKEAGAIVSFDLSSYDLIRLHKDRILEILTNYVDIVFANEDEVKELTGKASWEGCKALKEICPIAVVMIGCQGCIVGSGSLVHHSPAIPIKAIDTTGAGELFASGFLHGYLEGLSLERCAQAGNRTGAAVCEIYGAEIPQEKWTEIKTSLAK